MSGVSGVIASVSKNVCDQGREEVLSRGKVTLINMSPHAGGPMDSNVARAVAESDIVLRETGTPLVDLTRYTSAHTDLVDSEQWPIHAALPFYDLAYREGFVVTRIRVAGPRWPDDEAEHRHRCHELGLRVELVGSDVRERSTA